jgi:hypothetical protein
MCFKLFPEWVKRVFVKTCCTPNGDSWLPVEYGSGKTFSLRFSENVHIQAFLEQVGLLEQIYRTTKKSLIAN